MISLRRRGYPMGWLIAGIVVVALLAVAALVDFKDRGRDGKKIARTGLRESRIDDVVPPQVGDQGVYLNIPNV